MNEKFNFQVNLSGILDVLSNHLYTSADVFIRELLQNGVDAITMRKEKSNGFINGKIVISVVEEKSITFADNGIGLTEEEIHKFLAVIGQSSKINLVDNKIPQDYIGRFGIGLLSCFMVSDSITVYTSSIKEDKGYKWEGYTDGTYKIEEVENLSKGTKVVLSATPQTKKYFSEEYIENLVKYYGLALPIPVYFENRESPINNLPIEFPTNNQEELLYLGEWMFGKAFLGAIPINTSTLQGVAYILPYGVEPSVAKNGHRIYLKNMLLTENGDMLLPEWGFFLKVFLNTNTLRPTASRENFYKDDELVKAQEEFSEAVQLYLKNLSLENPELLRAIVERHSKGIKSIAIWNDELFQIFSDYLTFETSIGRVTGEYIKNLQSGVWVESVQEFNQLKSLFKAQEQILICGGYMNDSQLISKLIEMYNLSITMLQGDKMGHIMEDLSFVENQMYFDFVNNANKALKDNDCRIELKKLKLSNLPTLYVEDKNVQFLRHIGMMQEGMNQTFSNILDSVLGGVNTETGSILYLNYNSQVIKKLVAITNEELLEKIVQILYVQGLMAGGHPLKSKELQIMNESLLYLIEFTSINLN